VCLRLQGRGFGPWHRHSIGSDANGRRACDVRYWIGSRVWCEDLHDVPSPTGRSRPRLCENSCVVRFCMISGALRPLPGSKKLNTAHSEKSIFFYANSFPVFTQPRPGAGSHMPVLGIVNSDPSEGTLPEPLPSFGCRTNYNWHVIVQLTADPLRRYTAAIHPHVFSKQFPNSLGASRHRKRCRELTVE
jgi:hypothetical protein